MEVGHHMEVMDLALKVVELAINIATDTAIIHHQLMAGCLVRVVLSQVVPVTLRHVQV